MIERPGQWIVAVLLVVGAFPVVSRAPGADAPGGGTSMPVTAPAGPGGSDTRPVAPRRDDDAEDRAVGSDGGKGLGGSVLRTVLALGVVVALIFVLRFVLRRFGPGRQGRGRGGPMTVLARTSVSPRQQMLLVRLGRRLVLVGSGPEGMVSLAEVRDADEVAELVRLAQGPGAPVDADLAADERPPEPGREDRP